MLNRAAPAVILHAPFYLYRIAIERCMLPAYRVAHFCCSVNVKRKNVLINSTNLWAATPLLVLYVALLAAMLFGYEIRSSPQPERTPLYIHHGLRHLQ